MRVIYGFKQITMKTYKDPGDEDENVNPNPNPPPPPPPPPPTIGG